MMRQMLSFPCEGAMLFATLDLPDAAPTTGLLIVSGGNEIRSGAWGSHARIAEGAVAQGYAAFRFDRRGVGDSEGANGGFQSSAPDLAAAIAAFRAAVPSMTRVIALGNCDAASALMLSSGAGVDALVLSNPWTFEEENAGPSVQALRAHYRKRLVNSDALMRLLTGKVSLASLLGSLLRLARPAPPPAPLVQQMRDGLGAFTGPVRLLLAGNDSTAQAFAGVWDGKDARIARCDGASHSFVEPHAREWLMAQIIGALKGGA
ncbi:MAG: hydrolase 1, exosortase A system-associated [Novosphingobium sp. SCN 63-17]|nr:MULTISPECIES: hydrolase 1, exosortase A system-associated [unclassified Novosphingobium]MBN9145751.1 hydrolase 1, exosortase A system-associated [Novosphingobium sp.]ODU82356.1 MAG: hydrolase 1, exosortase A system-associated [Novosphingobium sp. SCN 63-17]OJX97144.1 MAG: hydrolase 1, exosortase A system-associated [Novosphingobium sp. 63-713]